jgi:hypothetical protein
MRVLDVNYVLTKTQIIKIFFYLYKYMNKTKQLEDQLMEITKNMFSGKCMRCDKKSEKYSPLCKKCFEYGQKLYQDTFGSK